MGFIAGILSGAQRLAHVAFLRADPTASVAVFEEAKLVVGFWLRPGNRPVGQFKCPEAIGVHKLKFSVRVRLVLVNTKPISNPGFRLD
jgi:hypothetical protein